MNFDLGVFFKNNHSISAVRIVLELCQNCVLIEEYSTLLLFKHQLTFELKMI